MLTRGRVIAETRNKIKSLLLTFLTSGIFFSCSSSWNLLLAFNGKAPVMWALRYAYVRFYGNSFNLCLFKRSENVCSVRDIQVQTCVTSWRCISAYTSYVLAFILGIRHTQRHIFCCHINYTRFMWLTSVFETYCDMSTLCWITQRNVARQPFGKQEFRAAAMTSHFRSKGMSRVFTWLPGDEPSCQIATGVGDVT
jgi:hypothetical protein